MDGLQEPYKISYYGVSIKITPITEGAHIQYLVTLPTRDMFLEMTVDYNENNHWVEVPGGSTQIADEIGALIESYHM